MNESFRTYVIDIDGTICTQNGDDYESALANAEVISVVNSLFEKGHEIVLFTARGSTTGLDWDSVTRTQLETWGVKYNRLEFGKPYGDYYIDDKNMSIQDFVRYAGAGKC